MDCTICHRPIERYSIEFNHLDIDETTKADICQDCIDKIIKWQGRIIGKLFPTSASKKRYG